MDLITSEFIYKPNERVNNLKEKYFLFKVLVDESSGSIKDVPFFENRINYMNDNVLIKRVV